MNLYRIILSISLFFASTAHALEAPVHGEFDWQELYGRYEFQNCQNAGAPIWQTDPANQYIVISHDPFDTRNVPKDYFAAALFHEPFSPIVPIWELADMGKGWVKTVDETTGELRKSHENYSTANGVYSRLEWNFGDDHGWATFNLSKIDESHLSYEMDSYYALSGNTKHESCSLVKTP